MRRISAEVCDSIKVLQFVVSLPSADCLPGVVVTKSLSGLVPLPFRPAPESNWASRQELLQVRIRFIEVSTQGAWLVLNQSQDTVKDVEQRGGVAILVGQPQLDLLAAPGEVAEGEGFVGRPRWPVNGPAQGGPELGSFCIRESESIQG